MRLKEKSDFHNFCVISLCLLGVCFNFHYWETYKKIQSELLHSLVFVKMFLMSKSLENPRWINEAPKLTCYLLKTFFMPPSISSSIWKLCCISNSKVLKMKADFQELKIWKFWKILNIFLISKVNLWFATSSSSLYPMPFITILLMH